MRILTGIQPSGKLHWGNYFGAMKNAFELQKKGMLSSLLRIITP